jgi:hypothetical protein
VRVDARAIHKLASCRSGWREQNGTMREGREAWRGEDACLC